MAYRYRFLRSQIQERSTAAFFIVRDQLVNYINQWISLLWCRKPETLEDSEKGLYYLYSNFIAKTNADEGLTIGVRIRMNIYNIVILLI